MPPTLHNASGRISPETFGPNDCFVGSHDGCQVFRRNGKHFYEINLYSGLNDNEKKRRIRKLLKYISDHPERTFYFAAIGCGGGHVDQEIIVHLLRPLVWKQNVRLPAQFLTILLKNESYKGRLDTEHRSALTAWHREYSARREMTNDPSFYNAATTYPEEVRNEIFEQISDFHLKRDLFNNNKKTFERYMNGLRTSLETIAKIPLPESKPPVHHKLRRDLSDWIRDGNSEIFEKLDFLCKNTNVRSHAGNHEYYDALPEEIMNNFKGFVIGFKAFLDMVYRERQEP